MKNLLIYGAGSIGRLLFQMVQDIGEINGQKYKCLGFIDDNASIHNQEIEGLPVLGAKEIILKVKNIALVIAFSNPHQRKKAYQNLKHHNNIEFISLIHPKSIISNNVHIGYGSVIYPGVIIDPYVKIGNFNIINKNSTIGHDSIYEDFCTISPGVNLGGWLKVGEGVEFGINSSTIQNLKIGKWSSIGAGGAVIKDIEPYTINVGIPAMIKKRLK